MISVVMSVFNGEKYLREAIESILEQTYKDFQFVIVNDGSTDSSLEIMREYQKKDQRIKIINQENTGLAKALNRGIKQAKGKYIARMDADDISKPDRLDKQIEFLENNPNCVALGTQSYVIDNDGNELFITNLPTEKKTIKENYLPARNPFYHGSVMFRKDSYIEVNGYNEDIIHFIEDLILWNNLSDIGELQNLSDALYVHRIQPNSLATRPKKIEKRLQQIVKNIYTTGELSIKDKQTVFLLNKKYKKKCGGNGFSSYYLAIGKAYFEKRSKTELARLNFRKAIKFSPFSFINWFNLIMTYKPLYFIQIYRLRKKGVIV